MAGFLTDDWVRELHDAAARIKPPTDVSVTIQQIVTHGDEAGEVAFAIRIADGTVTVTAGRDPDADVTFTQDRTTATAIARGELSAQAAFIAGRLRVGGDLRAAMAATGAITDLDDDLAGVRASTTW